MGLMLKVNHRFGVRVIDGRHLIRVESEPSILWDFDGWFALALQRHGLTR